MNENEMAELMEWQARCRDMETSKEQLREERDLLREQRDGAMERWKEACDKNEMYWVRITELEAALSKATAQVERLRIHLQQGIEL